MLVSNCLPLRDIFICLFILEEYVYDNDFDL